MPVQECPDKTALMDAIEKASEALLDLRAEQRKAVMLKRDTMPYACQIIVLRRVEVDALNALSGHRRQHRC
jgi:hypothetical protein